MYCLFIFLKLHLGNKYWRLSWSDPLHTPDLILVHYILLVSSISHLLLSLKCWDYNCGSLCPLCIAIALGLFMSHLFTYHSIKNLLMPPLSLRRSQGVPLGPPPQVESALTPSVKSTHMIRPVQSVVQVTTRVLVRCSRVSEKEVILFSLHWSRGGGSVGSSPETPVSGHFLQTRHQQTLFIISVDFNHPSPFSILPLFI